MVGKEVKVRYLTCFVLWLTLFSFYIFRSNLSIGMLAMTSQQTDPLSGSYSSCLKDPDPDVLSIPYDNYEFKWSQTMQGYILSSFFIGYFSTHVVGAVLALYFGPRIIMLICLFGASVSTFLLVPFAYMGNYYFIFGRFLIGVFSGPLYPVVHQLIGAYAPSKELNILTTITHTGNIVGLTFNFGVGGYIVEGFKDGWKYLFYLSGFIGMLTVILWYFLVFSSPTEHPLMSEEEKRLIKGEENKSNEHDHSTKEIPFRDIFSSPHVYIVSASQFANSFIMYALLTGLPKYLSSVYGLSKSTSSYLAIFPFLSNFLLQLILPLIWNYERLKGVISKTTYRRISNLIGFTGASTFLLSVGYVPCEYMTLSVVLVSTSLVFQAFNQLGYFTAMIDLSPKYSGMIMGIASMFGSLAGVIQPQLTAFMIKTGDKKIGYRYAFVATSCVSMLLGSLFVLFGSTDRQKWGSDKSQILDEKEKKVLVENEEKV